MREEIVRALKSTYVEQRTTYAGIPHVAKKFDAQFEKLADFCISNNCDPELLIRSQFDDSNDPKTLLPTMLLNKSTLTTYEAYIKKFKIDLDQYFEVWKNYLFCQLNNVKRSVEATLLDDNIPFPAWFRIVLTHDEIPAVTEKYIKVAKAQVTPEIIEFCKRKNLKYQRLING